MIGLIITIAFVATLFRSTFGFGEALIAVPLLGMFLPMSECVPLAVMMSIFVAAVVLIQDHSKVHVRSAKWLILSALPGIPVGLALLFYGNETVIKVLLGAVIIGYALYSLTGKNTYHLEKESRLWLFVCGFLSGVFGGAYGVNGPPLVVYGNLRRWDARNFRATLQAYFLAAGLVSMIGYAGGGMIDRQNMHYFAYCIPAIIPAILLGRYFNRRLQGESFYKYVFVGLIAVGTVLIVDSLL